MATYLYGAAVQGIQSFIFQTNKLKDIVGASGLVDSICKDLFKKTVEGIKEIGKWDEDSCILSAAGNIKYQFEDEELCKAVYQVFPSKVRECAPGITISQAVVSLSSEKDYQKSVEELEEKLRAKRNLASRPSSIGLMSILRSRQTGLPVTRILKKEEMDEGTARKRYHFTEDGIKERNASSLAEKAFGFKVPKDRLCQDISDMTDQNDWIAIIHADGNGLGQVVSKVGKDKIAFKEFSDKLEESTVAAANSAYERAKSIGGWKDTDIIPIRPIVLGGDDLTVICRADFALEYVSEFMNSFEKETSERMHSIFAKHGLPGLTACAGVAFVKSSYPFYYGYDLAEELCGAAKKASKSIDKDFPPSSLMFHKVQGSFVTDYGDLVEKELSPADGTSLKFGPYFLNAVDGKNDAWTVDRLLSVVNKLDGEEENAIRASLRNWLSLIAQNVEAAKQHLERMKAVHSGKVGLIKELTSFRNEDSTKVYPTYDVLAINTIKVQKTKTPKVKINKNDK